MTTPSLFGAPTATSTAAPSIFGASTAAPTSAPLFGASTTNNQPGLFGASTATSTAAPSIFGAPAAAPAAPSIFGAPTAPTQTGLLGAPTTATAAAPPIFGAPTAATQPSIFGAPAASSTAAPSISGAPAAAPAAPSIFGASTAPTQTGLLGASTATSTAAPSIFGAPTAATQPSIFGAPAASSTAPSIPGAPAAAPAASSIFGAPTAPTQTGLFGAPTTTTAAAASIFGAPTATTQPDVGLGGAQRTNFGASGGLQAPNQQDTINPKDGEVPVVLMTEFDTLKKTMKENNRLAEEFRMASNSENAEILKVDDDITAVRLLLFQQKSAVQKFRLKTRGLLEKVKTDLRMCEQATQRNESMGKNPRHGHQQAIHYMHLIVDQYEKNLLESKEMLAKLEQIIVSILDKDETAKEITQKELFDHLERFDKLFRAVTVQVHNTDTQELKDMFLEQRRRISRFAPNPFEKRHRREEDPYSMIKGVDPFPSQTALMELAEYLPKGGVQPAAQTALPGFGSTTSSLFAPKPTVTPFFSQQTTTAPSLFTKPFGATTTTTAPSLFSNTTPLFGGGGPIQHKSPRLGANTSASAAGTSTSTTTLPTFGSTLNSSASGTLFGGSASRPLFGK